MADDFYSLYSWVWLVIGIIITIIAEPFLEPFLPSNLRDKTKYWRKKIGKIIHATKIKVELVAKTNDVTDKMLDLENTLENLRKEFVETNYKPVKDQNSLKFDIHVGKKIIKASIIFMPDVVENKEIISQVECRFQHECGYLRFNSDVYELREAQRQIEGIIVNNISTFDNTINLVCELNSLYELTNVLSEAKIGMLTSSIENGKIHVSLGENVLTVTGKEISAEMLSLVRKMITVYF